MLGVLGCVERLVHARRMDEFARMLFVRVLRLRYAALRMTNLGVMLSFVRCARRWGTSAHLVLRVCERVARRRAGAVVFLQEGIR